MLWTLFSLLKGLFPVGQCTLPVLTASDTELPLQQETGPTLSGQVVEQIARRDVLFSYDWYVAVRLIMTLWALEKVSWQLTGSGVDFFNGVCSLMCFYLNLFDDD